MKKITTISPLVLLAMTVTGCKPINAPEGSPDDVAVSSTAWCASPSRPTPE